MSAGTFNVSRDLWKDDLFPEGDPASKREAWLWLVAEAAWKERTRNVGGKVIVLKRGQLLAPSRFLAKAWNWSEPKARRFLDYLENRRAIERVTDAGLTVVTICNYGKYQATPRFDDAETTRGPTQPRRARDANEKKGEIREEDNPPSPRKRGSEPEGFAEFWPVYPKRVDKQAAMKAWAKALREGAAPEEMTAGAKRYLRDARVLRGFAKNAATWLNGKCWEDEVEPEREAERQPGRGSPHLAVVGGRRGEWTAMGFIPED